MVRRLYHQVTICWRIVIVKHILIVLLGFLLMPAGSSVAEEEGKDPFLSVLGRYHKDATFQTVRDNGKLAYEMRFPTKQSPKSILTHYHNYLDEKGVPYKALTTDPKKKMMAHMLNTEIEGEEKKVLITPRGLKERGSIVMVKSFQGAEHLALQHPPLTTVFPEVGEIFNNPFISQELYAPSMQKGVYGVDANGSARSALRQSLKTLKSSGWNDAFTAEFNQATTAQDDHVAFLKKGNAFLVLASVRKDGQTSIIGNLKHPL